jgi:hypothetical protein
MPTWQLIQSSDSVAEETDIQCTENKILKREGNYQILKKKLFLKVK